MGYSIIEVDGVQIPSSKKFPVEVTPEAHAINGTEHTGVLDDVQIPAGIMRDNEHSSDPHTMTIDGRDVSVDGTKLDTIESGAEVNNISDANATELTGSGDTSLHHHDTRYYSKTNLQTSGQSQIHWDNITNEPATFPPESHNHDDIYYTETELDGGQLDTRYYTKTNHQTSGQSQVHWDNITNKPSFGGHNWLEPVKDKYDGSSAPSGSTPSGYSEGERIIWYSGTGHNDHIYEVVSGSWSDVYTPSQHDTVMVQDDGDGNPAQYWYSGTEWIKIADPDYSDHGSQGGLNDDDHTHYLTEARHDALSADNPHSVTISQTITADAGTDITTSELEDLTDGSDISLHNHDTMYYTKSDLNGGQLNNLYYTESEIDSLLANYADVNHNHDSDYSDISHNHDDRYFTETELGSTSDGSSGADIIGATAVGSGTATTVQGILEELEAEISSGSGENNYTTFLFGLKNESGISTGELHSISNTTLGYKLPRAQTLKSFSVLTDAENSNTYYIKKNGSNVTNLAFTDEDEGIKEGLDISFAKGDKITASITVSGSDINNSYTDDDDTLILFHVDGDSESDRSLTNSSDNCTGMAGRGYGTDQMSGGKFGGKCCDFDGNDYLVFMHHPDYDIQDCTIEFFFYVNSFSGDTDQAMFSKDSSGYDTGGHIKIGCDPDDIIIRTQTTSSQLEQWIETTVATQTWHHIAVVMGTGGLKVFFNGTSIYTNGSWTQGLDGNREPFILGGGLDSSGDSVATNIGEFFNGKINELRISKTRRYENNFTPPSSQFTPDANTVGLWHLDETEIEDIAYQDSSSVETQPMLQNTGSASDIVTSPVKFGTHAIKMNCSANDWMRINHNSDMEVLDFTIETHLRIWSDNTGVIFEKGDSNTEGGILFRCIQSDRRIEAIYYGQGANSKTVTTANNIYDLNEWKHVALVVDTTNNKLKLYVDGVLKDSETLDSNYSNGLQNNKNDVFIGKKKCSSDYLRAYLDEYRISKTARSFGNSNVTQITLVANFGG